MARTDDTPLDDVVPEVDRLEQEQEADPRVSVDLRAKRPGPDMELGEATMTVDLVEEIAGSEPLEAYERLLLDVLRGDHTLFTRADEVERLWEVVQPVLDDRPEVHSYEPGSWGPKPALDLPDGGWRLGG